MLSRCADTHGVTLANRLRFGPYLCKIAIYKSYLIFELWLAHEPRRLATDQHVVYNEAADQDVVDDKPADQDVIDNKGVGLLLGDLLVEVEFAFHGCL